ncbi:MAG: hypothetical protein L3J47_04645 [Sulfurovum sp.]|nr:hypothetical protein [Sulfurovum sp.]
MKHIVTAFTLFTVMLWGDMRLYPAKECQLFNNLKHTHNRGDVTLDMSRSYTMLKHHKGQYLLKVPHATPSQRWVDDDCLTLRPRKGTPLYGKTDTQPKDQSGPIDSVQKSAKNLLALSWHNAFCETHRYKKECKRRFFGINGSDDNFVLHGLWPQPRNKVYCGVEKRYIVADKHKQWHKLPEPKLTMQTKKELQSVMPGVDSNLHRHEWIKHGTCYGSDAETYFRDAITLTQQVQNSQVATFFRKYAGKRVTLQRIRELFDERFGKGAGSRVELRCNRGMISELWLHLNGYGTVLSQLLQKGKKVHSQCQRGIIDRAGYGR